MCFSVEAVESSSPGVPLKSHASGQDYGHNPERPSRCCNREPVGAGYEQPARARRWAQGEDGEPADGVRDHTTVVFPWCQMCLSQKLEDLPRMVPDGEEGTPWGGGDRG